MYQELEMYKTYKKEKADKIQHNHEQIASISAIAFFAVIGLALNYLA